MRWPYLWCTLQVEHPVAVLVGICTLKRTTIDEQLILYLRR